MVDFARVMMGEAASDEQKPDSIQRDEAGRPMFNREPADSAEKPVQYMAELVDQVRPNDPAGYNLLQEGDDEDFVSLIFYSTCKKVVKY